MDRLDRFVGVIRRELRFELIELDMKGGEEFGPVVGDKASLVEPYQCLFRRDFQLSYLASVYHLSI